MKVQIRVGLISFVLLKHIIQPSWQAEYAEKSIP